MQEHSIAIIGSGIAGLTAVALLVQAGHSVTVFEQFEHPGGVTASIQSGGSRWSLGQLWNDYLHFTGVWTNIADWQNGFPRHDCTARYYPSCHA